MFQYPVLTHHLPARVHHFHNLLEQKPRLPIRHESRCGRVKLRCVCERYNIVWEYLPNQALLNIAMVDFSRNLPLRRAIETSVQTNDRRPRRAD